jgi:hypothetical protein
LEHNEITNPYELNKNCWYPVLLEPHKYLYTHIERESSDQILHVEWANIHTPINILFSWGIQPNLNTNYNFFIENLSGDGRNIFYKNHELNQDIYHCIETNHLCNSFKRIENIGPLYITFISTSQEYISTGDIKIYFAKTNLRIKRSQLNAIADFYKDCYPDYEFDHK